MKNKYYIIIFAVLFSVVVYYFFGYKKSTVEYKIESATITRGDIILTVRATGIAIPKNRLEVKPPIAGRVESILAQEGQQVGKGKILVWMSSTERAALLDAARAKGPEEIKKWEDFYKPTPVISPLRGLVIVSNISSGQTVTQQDILFVLSDTLMVQAKVDETDLSKIKIGQYANIVVDSFSSEPVQAIVKHIGYEAVVENNVTMYNVDLELNSIPSYLRSGMSITVDFILASEKNVILVPNDFIKSKNGKGIVLQKNNELYIESNIEIGFSDDQNTAVYSGLAEGDIVYRRKKNLESKKSNGNAGPFSSPRLPKR